MIAHQIRLETRFAPDRSNTVGARRSKAAPIGVGLARLSVILACVAFWAVAFHAAGSFTHHAMATAQLSVGAPSLGR
jgi:hypothetical protein